MNEHIYKELIKIEKKEQRLFRSGNLMNVAAITQGIEAKIPPGFRDKLNAVFFQGFNLIFKNGTGLIEKTYNREKSSEDYNINNYAFDTLRNKRGVRRIASAANHRHFTNLGIAAGEGAGLGLLGIGLPDIPLFIGVLLKSVYETAASYGFTYESDEEKYYILLIIQAALANGGEKESLNAYIDQIGAKLDRNIVINHELSGQTEVTAQSLADDLLVLKFIQGIPLVGVVGGVTNVAYCNKITNYAKLKYKKRYLRKKLDC